VNLEEARIAVEQRGFDYLSAPRIYVMLNAAKDTFEDVYDWPWLHGLTTGATPLTIADLKLVMMVKTPRQRRAAGPRRASGSEDDHQLGAGRHAAVLVDRGDHEAARLARRRRRRARLLHRATAPRSWLPADTPLIPARYHHLWIDLAVVEAYKDSDNFQAAQLLRAMSTRCHAGRHRPLRDPQPPALDVHGRAHSPTRTTDMALGLHQRLQGRTTSTTSRAG
jgi:hypothetical protein